MSNQVQRPYLIWDTHEILNNQVKYLVENGDAENEEKWFGQEIIILGNDKYNRSIYEVFKKTRYLKGPSGARCTGELKKTNKN